MEKTTEVLDEKKLEENQEVAELDGPETDEDQDVNAPDAAKKKKKKKKKGKKPGNLCGKKLPHVCVCMCEWFFCFIVN